jgi:hypothetical protein
MPQDSRATVLAGTAPATPNRGIWTRGDLVQCTIASFVGASIGVIGFAVFAVAGLVSARLGTARPRFLGPFVVSLAACWI